MFRGNIDFASRTRIEGWVYCSRWSLVGARVHAFIDDECVGSGIVELFRRDLVEAGVGDGMGGFNFAISLDEDQDPRRLHIRVEDGNAIVRQPGSQLCSDRGDVGVRNRLSPTRLDWMLERGWMSPGQHRVLSALGEFGVARERLGPITGEDPAMAARSALEGSRDTFELLFLSGVSMTIRPDLTQADLGKECRALRRAFPDGPPVIAICAPAASSLMIVEASHLQDPPMRSGGGVEYEFGPDQLLWLNLECAIHAPTGGLAAPLWAAIPMPDRGARG